VTTVAYKDGIIAADTQATYGSTPVLGASKIRRIRIGAEEWVVGISGEAWVCERLLVAMKYAASLDDWFWDPCPVDKDDLPSCMAVRARDGAIYTTSGGKSWSRLNSELWAIGSGCDYALGAMHAGASASDAVRIASALDVYTGGIIDTEHVLAAGKPTAPAP